MRVSIRVKPGSARPGVGGEHDGALIVRVSARAVDGKATEAALTAVADSFGIRRSAVRLVSGASSRIKVIDIDVGDPLILAALLDAPGRLRLWQGARATRASNTSKRNHGRSRTRSVTAGNGRRAPCRFGVGGRVPSALRPIAAYHSFTHATDNRREPALRDRKDLGSLPPDSGGLRSKIFHAIPGDQTFHALWPVMRADGRPRGIMCRPEVFGWGRFSGAGDVGWPGVATGDPKADAALGYARKLVTKEAYGAVMPGSSGIPSPPG